MKTCNKCNIEKEFIDFYKKNRINCIECIKKEKIENKKIKIQNISNDLFDNEYIIGNLIDDKSMTKHIKCGYEWLMNYNNHIYKNKGCPKCYGNVRLTNSEVQKKSNDIHNDEFIIDEAYFKNNKYKIKHIKCGYEFHTTKDSHIYGKTGCPKCSKKVRVKIEDVVEYSKGKGYTIISDSIENNTSRILVKHDKCGNNWNISVANFMRGRGCGNCKRNKKLDIDIIQERSNKLHNNEYRFIGEYKNTNIPIQTKHIKCGHVWNMLVCPHLSNRMVGCPKCSRSIGERKIEKWLLNNRIEYKIEHNFKDCVNSKELSFDFYLDKYKLCLEYDGEQHFRPIEHFGGIEKFKKQMINDDIKNNYCKNNNINLLRISYYENIDNKLSNYFYEN